MRLLPYVLILAVGFGAGWFIRGLGLEESADRSGGRAKTTLPREHRVISGRVEDEARFLPSEEEETRQPEPLADPEPESGPEPEAGKKKGPDPIEEMVKSQTKMWSAWARMQSKQKIEKFLEELGFDAETTRRIEEAIAKEAERQTELATQMMLSSDVEMNADAFYWFMGIGPEVTLDLERELGAFLGDDDIAAVRAQMKAAHRKHIDDMTTMTIGMMGIPNLSDDQKTRIREAFSGRDFMQEQFVGFAELTRNREKLGKLVIAEGKGLREEMQRTFGPTREHMRRILDDVQFERYETYEAAMIKQAEMGFKMMAGMLKGSEKPADK